MNTPLLQQIAAICLGGLLTASTTLAGSSASPTASLYVENAAFTAPTTATVTTTGTATASLKATARKNNTGAVLTIKARGFDAGTYTVNATLATDSRTVALGTFTVAAATTSTSSSSSSSGSTATTTTDDDSSLTWRPPHHGGRRLSHHGGRSGGDGTCGSGIRGKDIVATFGGTGTAFPDGVNPFDIATVSIADANAAVLLVADFTTIVNGSLFYSVPLTAGTLAAEATGVASIVVRIKDGVTTGAFALSASGVPASTTYTYSLEDTDIATVTTTAKGRLRLCVKSSALPDTIDLFTLMQAVVHDDADAVLVSASF